MCRRRGRGWSRSSRWSRRRWRCRPAAPSPAPLGSRRPWRRDTASSAFVRLFGLSEFWDKSSTATFFSSHLYLYFHKRKWILITLNQSTLTICSTIKERNVNR